MSRARDPNLQDLLKFCAMISMFVDHIGIFLFYDNWLRVVGRFALCIFCYFVGYNASRGPYWLQNKHLTRIILAGLIVHLVQWLCIGNMWPLNILLSIAINFGVANFILRYKIPLAMSVMMLIFLSIFCFDLWDYGTFPVIFILLGACGRQGARGWEYGTLLAVTLISLLGIEYLVMNFTAEQTLCVFLMFAVIFYLLLTWDFRQKVSSRIFLLSRFVLPFYVVHISLMMIISIFL